MDVIDFYLSKNPFMKRCIILYCALLFLGSIQAQTFRHYDFLGGGHTNEVTVTTSSSAVADGQKTIDGFPINNPEQLKDASRFLAQATYGADFSTIEMTAAMGYEAWLEEQFQLPQISILQEMEAQDFLYYEREEDEDGPQIWSDFVKSAWVTNNMTAPDLLRHRMAFHLSQIMVINTNSDFFEDIGQIGGGFFDMLTTNAFGNYQQLLLDVTLSPAMGNFLSHYNNPKADPSNNIHPDENYAREIMQLFSIGLWELNADGTRKRDAQGQFIPTYNNADIKEFAQVFTGLGNGSPFGAFGVSADDLGFDVVKSMTTPMRMYNAYHDTSEKHLLNGLVLPAHQSGMEDIQQTIAHLSGHSNTAPFICQSLIKMMTTSNPSPQYVADVAAVFKPNVPNNFQEILRAILLHPEARTCQISHSYTFGKLRDPLTRLMNLLRAFPITANENGDYYYLMECFAQHTGQAPLEAPSVFNFFLPDYQPPGPIGQNYLVAPEFQILNATNVIGLVNNVDTRVIRNGYFIDLCIGEEEFEEEEEPEELQYYWDDTHIVNYEEELALIDQPAALINRLDILLANGLLSADTKNIITNAMAQLADPEEKLKMAIYLILISPDYAILK